MTGYFGSDRNPGASGELRLVRHRSSFYVYTHARPDGSVFYVGKGRGRRAWNMKRDASPHHRAIVDKYGADQIIVSVYDVASEAEAFAKERALIAEFRERGARLANKTDGGEGASGRPVSDRVRAILRESGLKGRSSEWRARQAEFMRTRVVSAETRRKLGDTRKGLKRPPHVIQALVAANTGRPLSEAHRKVSAAHLAEVKHLAAAWHKSEEGRAWHRAHGAASWADREMHTASCGYCGKLFQTPFPTRAKWCHNNCKAAARRAAQRTLNECGVPGGGESAVR